MPSLLPDNEKTILLYRQNSELGLEIQSGVRRYRLSAAGSHAPLSEPDVRVSPHPALRAQ